MKSKQTITGQINQKALELLSKEKNGIRWKDLQILIKDAYPDFHPKTINGCIWKLTEKYPDKVYKPEKGVFRLLEYRK
jgi:6-phosphogluconolactonase/glucosamine-6-phosphate isomerase/deaminase